MDVHPVVWLNFYWLHIQEKHHHIETGKYLEMWVVGYNAVDKEGNRDPYKVFIEEAMVYNLINEGEEYMISATSFKA